jgi:steroid delta-isomerase-like uncharacterized protein
MLKIIRLRGPAALDYIDDISRLRIEVFREFPYLYDGDRTYEEKYLATYFSCPDSVVVLAIEDAKVVGASTGLPLIKAEPEWQKAFAQSPYPIESIFYFGESVLQKDYRGRGLGHSFFDQREEFAASLPDIRYTAFCSVLREKNHPRRPKDYRSNELFWNKRSYQRIPGLLTEFHWKDLDETQESSKPMEFWIRELPPKEALNFERKHITAPSTILQNYYDAFNRGDWEGMLALLSDDVVHDANQGGRTQGKEAFRSFLHEMAHHYKEQLSDFRFMPHPNGAHAAAEFQCTGTYLKTQAGLPEAKGQTYRLPVGTFFDFKNGLITRVTNYYNLPDWIRQVKGS